MSPLLRRRRTSTLCQRLSQGVLLVPCSVIFVSRGGVDDEDLVRVRIGPLAQVHVVKMRRVLEAEEQAHVAVVVVAAGALDFG